MSTTFAILAYDGIEPIDIGATFGVFSMAKRIAPELGFFVLSRDGGQVEMANGLGLLAQHRFAECPEFDVLIVLGGPGWEAASNDKQTLKFIRDTSTTISSVCTGGMILAAAGVLDGLRATTKREILLGEKRPLDLLGMYDDVDAVEDLIVDEGAVITGGGVSLGIDLTLYLLERFLGAEVADETARILEYRHARSANAKAFGELKARPKTRT
ncbi:MAG: DJ-1/PfpI family protein [Paracoccaceae bacterium]